MTCPIGPLQAYVEGELPADERQELDAHLAGCAECRFELQAVRARWELLRVSLGALSASAIESDARRALTRFRAAQGARLAWPARISDQLRRLFMNSDNGRSPRWRTAAFGVTAVVVLALVFSFAPVRQAAADFLSLFRVRKFAVIPVNPAQIQKLEELAKMVDSSNLQEPQIIREPGEERPVQDAAEASAAAGFAVRFPTELPEGATVVRTTVATGPAMHAEIQRSQLETILSAAGFPEAPLPPQDILTFDIDVASLVNREFRLPQGHVTLAQLPSPEVAMPEGIDPVALGQIGFQLMGMPRGDAERMAQSIDWSTTLVIPMPDGSVKSREVQVDGVTGVLFEPNDYNAGSMVLWERDGIVYSLEGNGLGASQLLRMADSLQ